MESILFISKKPAMIFAVLLGFLLLANIDGVLAASGGVMGGTSFSSSESFSSSFSSDYYITDSRRGGKFNVSSESAGSGDDSVIFSVMMVLVVFAVLLLVHLSRCTRGGSAASDLWQISVIKLQVGLLGSARPFQKKLDQIAEAADTSTSQGLSYILKETSLALLQHPDCCISAFSSVDVKSSVQDGEKHFKEVSMEERAKFDVETLVNFDSIKIRKTAKLAHQGFNNEYIVVTILVAARGLHDLPEINNDKELKRALQKLASIPRSKTLAVEVLWTPQKENDILSEREYLEGYPLLRPF